MYLYIIKSQKLTKIGISNNAYRRFKEVAQNGRFLFVRRLFYAYHIEQWLHKKYRHKNKRPKMCKSIRSGYTEWFALNYIDLAVLVFMLNIIWLIQKLLVVLAYILAAFSAFLYYQTYFNT